MGNLNFDGGTLVANMDGVALIGDSIQGITYGGEIVYVRVREGGATIDTQDDNVSIEYDMTTDVANDGGLTKLGSGTLYLNGANTYTGDTLVSEGTLAGSGSVSGNVEVALGAALEPGASIGDLSIGGDLTLDGTLLIEYNGAADPAIDLLIVGGDLGLASASLDFAKIEGGSDLTAESYVFLTYDGDRNDEEFASISNVPAGYSVAYDIDGGQNVGLIPEPSTLLLLALGLIGAAYLRRR